MSNRMVANATARGIVGIGVCVAALLWVCPGVIRLSAAAAPQDTNLDLIHFATRAQQFDELVFKLAPGDNKQARVLLRGLDVLSGEIADYRIRNKIAGDPALESISNRIVKLRQDILRIESASPEEVEHEVQKQVETLRQVAWDVGNLEDRAARLAAAASADEKKTRLLSGRTLPAVSDEMGKHLSLISDGLEKVSEANGVMASIQEKILAYPNLYQFDLKLTDQLTEDRKTIDDLTAILAQRRQQFTTVRDAIAELQGIEGEVQAYPTAYASAINAFRAHLILSSPEAFSSEMRNAHGKLVDAERLIEEGKRSEATALLVEAQSAYDRWAPTYQKAEELYLAAKSEHDRVDALGARRTSIYAFLFQNLAGTIRDMTTLETAESRGIERYLRAVEPLHDDFSFWVDRYQTVAETWAYVGGAGLKQRLQALLIDSPASSGKSRVVQK